MAKKKTAKKPKKAAKKPVKKKTVKKPVKKKAVKKAVKKPAKKEIKGTRAQKEIKIQNIVATASLERAIPLVKLAEMLPNTEYNPEQFPGLVMRIKDPKTSALIFSSGKIVCTGAKSMKKVKEAIQRIIENLKKVKINITFEPKATVQNMVASGSIGLDLNLNSLAIDLENTEYEPEQFPGLVYKLPGTRATFLLFSNGKIVCTGTRSESKLHDAVDKLIENLAKKGYK
jgi:transcription initiation factor TFIID TATA-box-binding protein